MELDWIDGEYCVVLPRSLFIIKILIPKDLVNIRAKSCVILQCLLLTERNMFLPNLHLFWGDVYNQKLAWHHKYLNVSLFELNSKESSQFQSLHIITCSCITFQPPTSAHCCFHLSSFTIFLMALPNKPLYTTLWFSVFVSRKANLYQLALRMVLGISLRNGILDLDRPAGHDDFITLGDWSMEYG